MHYRPLTPVEIAEALQTLPEWEYKEAWLRKTYGFASFKQAIDFVAQVAHVAEQLDHHPDIYVRVQTVVLILQTHQANHQVTDFDVQLARAIDQIPFAR